MKEKALLPIVAATITATVSWAVISKIISGALDWVSLLAFVVPFSATFGVLWWRRALQKKNSVE